MSCKLIPVLTVALAATTPASAQIVYGPPEVRGVAGVADYGLTGASNLGSLAMINNRGDIALSLGLGALQPRLWLNGSRLPTTGAFYASPHVDLSNTGVLYFNGQVRALDGTELHGIFRYDPAAGTEQQLPLDFVRADPIAASDSGAVTYYSAPPEEPTHLNQWDPTTGNISVIAAPGFGFGTGPVLAQNDLDQTVYSIRGGNPLMDQLWRHDPNATAMLLAEFPVLSLDAPYVTTNNSGQFTFLVEYSLFRSDGATTTEIVRTGNSPGSQLERILTSPLAMSDDGVVVFAAIGLDGVTGIYVADGTSLDRIVATGDSIETSVGQGVVSILANGKGIGMNAAGDVAAIVRLNIPGWGTPEALIVIPAGDLCSADWNSDGAVNSTDIAAFLADWIASINGGTLDADFNGDGEVTSADISSFLTAWLASLEGC